MTPENIQNKIFYLNGIELRQQKRLDDLCEYLSDKTNTLVESLGFLVKIEEQIGYLQETKSKISELQTQLHEQPTQS